MRTSRARIAPLVAACFVLFGVLFASAPASALRPDEVFIVAPVPVDMTAESALAARSQALKRGQVIAWKRLMARLTLPNEAGALMDYQSEQLEPLIQGFEVLRERTSAVRYLASVSYRFNRDEVRRVLAEAGVAFAETPSRPVLIIPVLTSQGVGVLWEDPNPWREAWQNLPPRDGLLPIAVPYSDLADIRDLSTVQALRGDEERLRAVADRYGARDVVVAKASRTFDQRDNRPVLEIAIVRRIGDGLEETIIESIKGQNPDDLIGLLDAGVTRVVSTLSSSWKRANLVLPGLETRVTVVVPIDGFGRWLSIRRRLDGIGVLRRFDLLRISKREALMDLWVQGGAEQLRNAIRQRDLELLEGRVVYVLADRDQRVPEIYLPASQDSDVLPGAATDATTGPAPGVTPIQAPSTATGLAPKPTGSQ
jgi:hypothetical protein